MIQDDPDKLIQAEQPEEKHDLKLPHFGSVEKDAVPTFGGDQKENTSKSRKSEKAAKATSPRNFSLSQHRRILKSRNQSAYNYSSQGMKSVPEGNNNFTSDVSISESDLKMSLNQVNILNHFQYGPAGIDNGQDTVLQQRMEMMSKKQRSLFYKQTSNHRPNQMDSSISISRGGIDKLQNENATNQMIAPHRDSYDSIGPIGRNRRSIVGHGQKLKHSQQKEFSYLSDLTIVQKITILFYNCSETFLVIGLLINSLLHIDLSAMVQFGVSMVLAYSLTSQKDNVAYKKTLVWVIVVFSSIFMLTKVILIVSGVASSSKDKQPEIQEFLKSIGCQFHQDDKQSVDMLSMLIYDGIYIIICIFYFLNLKMLNSAHQGNKCIQRTKTRIVPLPRQRQMTHIGQGIESVIGEGKFDTSLNHVGAANFKDINPQKISPMLELLLPNSQKIELEIKQNILFHSYLGEVCQYIYYILYILFVTEISMHQSIPQFLIYIFIIGQMYRWLNEQPGFNRYQQQRSQTFYSQHNVLNQAQQQIQINDIFSRKTPNFLLITQRGRLVNIIQWLLFSQILLNFILNIPLIQYLCDEILTNKDPNESEYQKLETYLNILGINFSKTTDRFYIIGHFAASSTILCVAGIYKLSVDCLTQQYQHFVDNEILKQGTSVAADPREQNHRNSAQLFDEHESNLNGGNEFSSHSFQNGRKNMKTITRSDVFQKFQQPLINKKNQLPPKRKTLSSEDNSSNMLMSSPETAALKGPSLRMDELPQTQNSSQVIKPMPVSVTGISRQGTTLPNQTSSLPPGALRRQLPLLLIFINRFLALYYSYCYHSWLSLITLVWLCHSFLITNVKAFSLTTRKFYLPLFILINFEYYVVNIDSLIQQPITDQNNQYFRMGVWKFEYQFTEVILQFAMLALIFVWIKLSRVILPEDEDYKSMGLQFAQYMSDKQQYTVFNLLLLLFPNVHYLLLLVIFMQGIHKLTLFNVIYLFIFIGFLSLPARQNQIIRFLLGYTVFFLVGKYLYTLNYNKFDGTVTKDWLVILGISSTYYQQDQQTFFEYSIIWPQWNLLIVGLVIQLMQNFFGHQEIEQYYQKARQNFRLRYPTVHKTSQFFYNLKKSIIIFMVFMIFYGIIVISPRSFIYWGFLIIWSLLFFIELSFGFQNINIKKNAWSLMIFYSALVILCQFLYTFLRTDIMKKEQFIKNFWNNIPTWIIDYPNIIGFPEDKTSSIPNSENNNENFKEIYVFLMFFMFSVYIKSEIIKWHKDEEEFKQQMINSLENNIYQSKQQKQVQKTIEESVDDGRGNFQQQGSLYLSIVKLQTNELFDLNVEQQLDYMLQKKTEISLQYNRIRFTPEYFAYSMRSFWNCIDFYAKYNHIILQFTVLLLTLFWWLNLVNCLQILACIIFNIRVGKKVSDVIWTHYKKYSSKVNANDQNDTKNEKNKQKKKKNILKIKDVDLCNIKQKFDNSIDQVILKERYYTWNFQYILVLLTIVLIYPSELLSKFENMKETNQQEKITITTYVYYLFISGLYQDVKDKNVDESEREFYIGYIYGYLVILSLCIVERICIQWLRDRFGCDQHAYSIIDQFQQKIIEIDNQIQKLEQKIQDKKLIERRENMRRLRSQKGVIEIYDDKNQKILKTGMDQIEERQDEDISFEFSQKNSKKISPSVAKNPDQYIYEEQKENPGSISKLSKSFKINLPTYQKWLRDELKKRLLVDSMMKNMSGIRVFLENVIVLLILFSAILKMNALSIIYFILVVIYKMMNNFGSMRLIMDTTSIFIFFRLVLVLSNLQDQDNMISRPFPKLIIDNKAEFNMTFKLPWMNQMQQFEKQDPDFASQMYFYMIIFFKHKINSFLFDFFILCLIFIFYQECQFWCMDKNYEVYISSDTQKMLHEYLAIQNNPQNNSHISGNIGQKTSKSTNKEAVGSDSSGKNNSNRSEDEQCADETPRNDDNSKTNYTPRSTDLNDIEDAKSSKRNRNQMNKLIKNLQGSNLYYRLYKHLQRTVIISNPTFFMAVVLILAILSQTVFSLAYITFLSYAMLKYRLFLEVNKARFVLRPIIKNIMMPLVLFEIAMHILYQAPFIDPTEAIVSGGSLIHQLIIMFDLKKYYIVFITNDKYIYFDEKADERNIQDLIRLCFKAAIFFFLSLQEQIFISRNFERINEIKRVGFLKGKSMTYRFNNKKIKQYIKYQQINLKKEQMMIKVKADCDRWRTLFQDQAELSNIRDAIEEGPQQIANDKVTPSGENTKQSDIVDKVVQDDKIESSPTLDNKGTSLTSDQLDKEEQDEKQDYSLGARRQNISSISQTPTGNGAPNLFQRPMDMPEVVRSVNSDFLAIRQLSIKKQMQQKQNNQLKKITQDNKFNKQESESSGQILDIETSSGVSQDIDDVKEIRKSKLKEKKAQLPFLIQFYVILRKKCVNPILFANDEKRIEEIRQEMYKGSTQVKSSIELALQKDLRSEELTGVPTTKHLDDEIKFYRMIMRFAKLFQQIFHSNIEILAYIFMITEAVINPGILTLVYPISVFGYALIEETRPRRYFWYFIMIYTQLFIIIQYMLSLRYWSNQGNIIISESEKFDENIQRVSYKYFLGFNQMVSDKNMIIPQLQKFLSKILILWASVSLVHNEVILCLHEKKEQDIEPINVAYIRFVKGQFGTIIENQEKKEEIEKEQFVDIGQELNQQIYNSIFRRSIDDFYINYSSRGSKITSLHELDMDEIKQYQLDFRPFKSDWDINEQLEANANNQEFGDRPLNIRRIKYFKTFEKKLSNIFVKSKYMKTLYPPLKIQKPGHDFYTQMVFCQVVMGIYIFIFYPKMSAEQDSILSQINKSQFSGSMVLFLTCIIIMIIIDRYIYKSKTFIQHESSTIKNQEQQQNVVAQTTSIMPKLVDEGKLFQNYYMQMHQSNTDLNQSKHDHNGATSPMRRSINDVLSQGGRSSSLYGRSQTMLPTFGKPKDQSNFVEQNTSNQSFQPIEHLNSSQQQNIFKRRSTKKNREEDKNGSNIELRKSNFGPIMRSSPQYDMPVFELVQTGKDDSEEEKDADNLSQLRVDKINQSLARNKISFKSVLKFYYQWFIILVGHFILIYYLPKVGNEKLNNRIYCDPIDLQKKRDNWCNNLNENKFIWIFYLIMCMYLFISAMQIKYGLPEVMTSYFMLNKYHWLNKLIFLGFYNIPFVFEFRTIIDWTYSKSTLDVYQWIKLSQIQTDLYKAKCNNLFYMSKKIGEPLPSWYRYLVGLSLIMLILALVMGPMFMFSSFDIFGDFNPVNYVTVQLSLGFYTGQNAYLQQKLFESSSILQMKDLDSDQFNNIMKFNMWWQTLTYQPKQVQYIMMNDYSQERSYISEKVKMNIINKLDELKNDTSDSSKKIAKIEVRYLFQRSSPRSALYPIGNQTIPLYSGNNTEYITILDNFKEAFSNNSELIPLNFTIKGFNPVIALGQTLNVEEFDFETESFNNAESEDRKKLTQSLLLTQDSKETWTLKSEPMGVEENLIKNITENYYVNGEKNPNMGLSFFVFSRKTLPSIINFPLITFYISIIYVVAKLFRTSLVPISAAVIINDAPFPEDILMLCETIKLYRLKGRLEAEEELFFLLIDIMRTPQVLKAICGDSTKTLEKQVQQQKKEEGLKAERERRWKQLVVTADEASPGTVVEGSRLQPRDDGLRRREFGSSARQKSGSGVGSGAGNGGEKEKSFGIMRRFSAQRKKEKKD